MKCRIEDVPIEETEIYRRLKGKAHGVIVNIGTGQQGKSVLAHILAEEFWPNREVVMVNMPPDAFNRLEWGGGRMKYRNVKLPDNFHQLPELINPSRDVLILDDAVYTAGARRSMSRDNTQLQAFMTIISHWELPLIYTAQNTSLIDISTWQAQDQFWFHKWMDPMSLKAEREDLVVTQAIANEMLTIYREIGDDVHPKSYSYCSTTDEMVSFEMLDWWIDKPRPEEGLYFSHSRPLMGVIP